jgi:hypothetical protein
MSLLKTRVYFHKNESSLNKKVISIKKFYHYQAVSDSVDHSDGAAGIADGLLHEVNVLGNLKVQSELNLNSIKRSIGMIKVQYKMN